jgi:hypothetical protein
MIVVKSLPKEIQKMSGRVLLYCSFNRSCLQNLSENAGYGRIFTRLLPMALVPIPAPDRKLEAHSHNEAAERPEDQFLRAAAACRSGGLPAIPYFFTQLSASMNVSNQQLRQLGQARFQMFTNEMVEHAKTYFPENVAAAGEPAIRETIALCIRRSKPYGITSTRNICLWLNAALVWGSFFDIDPQLPWAQAILADPRFPDPTMRINALSDASEAAWNELAGPDQSALTQCFGRILQAPDRVYNIIVGGDGEAFLQLLRELYSTKAAAVGPLGVRELVARARAVLTPQGLSRTPLEVMLSFLMFLFGAGVAQDPQLPWLDRILDDTDRYLEGKLRDTWARTCSHLNLFLSHSETSVESHA